MSTTELPGVSILCPTYGRTRVLVELIESFYRQTYTGPCELVILNDLKEQNLQLDLAAVRADRLVEIITTAERFPDLGTKRNTLLDLAKYPLVAFWDDDDIYLSHFLARSVARYQERAQAGWHMTRESHAWVHRGSPAKLSLIDSGPFWTMLVERDLLLAMGSFPPQHTEADVDLFAQLIKASLVPGESNTPGLPGVIRRWRTTPYEQLTPLRQEMPKLTSDVRQRLFERFTSSMIADGKEPTGTILLKPAWAKDYEAMAVAAFEGCDRPNMTQPPSGPALPAPDWLHRGRA